MQNAFLGDVRTYIRLLLQVYNGLTPLGNTAGQEQRIAWPAPACLDRRAVEANRGEQLAGYYSREQLNSVFPKTHREVCNQLIKNH